MNGKTPKPTEVILTAQSWTCRFKEAFETKKNHDRPNKGIQFNHQNIGGCWDLIIKIARARKARPKRTSFAYEASNKEGSCSQVVPAVELLQLLQQRKKL